MKAEIVPAIIVRGICFIALSYLPIADLPRVSAEQIKVVKAKGFQVLQLKPMSPSEFAAFKTFSLQSYAATLANVEGVSIEATLKDAREQFARIAPNDAASPGQLFFSAFEGEEMIGYLWFGISDRFGARVAMINDIHIDENQRGKGFGKKLMRLVEQEAKNAGAVKIRLHVFENNEVARRLYHSMGFRVTSLNMSKSCDL